MNAKALGLKALAGQQNAYSIQLPLVKHPHCTLQTKPPDIFIDAHVHVEQGVVRDPENLNQRHWA